MADAAFRDLAENIPTLCWIADAEGYILWYNRRWYDYTGTTPEQMQGWGWQSVHDPKALAEILEHWAAAISTAQPFEMLLPIRGADGITRPFLTRINPAFDEHGAVVNWFGVNTDISRQVEAEAAFARSEARFRVLADSMPQIVWITGQDGGIDYFNARWYEFTGLPVGSSDGDAWSALVHPDDRDRAVRLWAQALASGQPYHTELRFRHHSLSYRWFLSRAEPESGPDGRPVRWYGSCTDIEDIVQARQILKRSRDELETEVRARTGERNMLAMLVEATDMFIMAIDHDFRVLAINKSNADEFERLYGRRAAAGDCLLDLLADQPEQCAALRAAWQRALAGEETTRIETRGNPALHVAHYEISFRVLRDSTGAAIGAFQFAQDVTEKLRDQAMLAQAREALVQSQKLESLGQLTGGVAHDFNNLLTPILSSLEMLHRRGVGGPREQRLIDAAFQSAERARLLVQRLLAFARRQPLQLVPIDARLLINDLAPLLASTMGPGITLRLDMEDDLPPARADPVQLEMALLNLCVNARDAMHGAGLLGIVACRATVADAASDLGAGDYIQLSVIDSGEGMDAATCARAIEPFFSTKGIGKGTGLGLSMAHGLARQSGGTLRIESRPGYGTTISIWLPQTTHLPHIEPADPSAAPPMSAQGLVLVVDDEEYIRLSTADMLTDLGFTVQEAASAQAALALIEAGLRPDLVITDHLMPGMSGVELAHALQAHNPAIRTLIVSGFAEAEGIDPALPRLTKPFVQSELADFLK